MDPLDFLLGFMPVLCEAVAAAVVAVTVAADVDGSLPLAPPNPENYPNLAALLMK